MAAILSALEELPRQNASRVKNQWGEVVRMVQERGTVAVTNHSKVEMVLVNAATYHQLVKDSQALHGREQSFLEALDQRFDARLATLQQDGAAAQVGRVLAATGQLRSRPKAGATF